MNKSLLQVDDLEMEFHSPFQYTPGESVTLSKQMFKEDTLKLIFNDKIDTITNCSAFPGQESKIIAFKKKKTILLTESSFSEIPDNKKFRITIHNKHLDKEVIDQCFETDSVQYYLRFRYKVNRKTTSNIYTEKNFFDEQVLVDFRFNELRSLDHDNGITYDQIISIGSVFIFVIQPMNYSIALNSDTYLQHIRVLEKKNNSWLNYIEELKKHKKNFLVYYWKSQSNESPTSYFNLLISFKTVRGNIFSKLKFAIEIGIISFAAMYIPELVSLDQIWNDLVALTSFEWSIDIDKKTINTILQSLGSVGFMVVIGTTGNAFWELIKLIYKQYKK